MSGLPYGWRSQAFWVRVLMMLIVAALLYFAIMAAWILVLVQLVAVLVTGSASLTLQGYSRSLSVYVKQSYNYLSFVTEDKPFPFSDWPSAE